MKYTLKDLEQEFEAWFKNTKEQLEDIVFPCEVSVGDIKNSDLLKEGQRIMYKFVTEGIWECKGNTEEDFYVEFDEYESIGVLGHTYGYANPCHAHLNSKGQARYTLFGGQDLTIKDVALLADLDERSVRNAASTGKKELKTFKSGSSTMIKASDAETWLAGRRGYKPTKVITKDPKGSYKDFHKDLIKILKDKYVKGNKTTLDEVFSTMGLGAGRDEDIDKLKEGVVNFNLDELAILAAATDHDFKVFIDAITRTFYRKNNGAWT